MPCRVTLYLDGQAGNDVWQYGRGVHKSLNGWLTAGGQDVHDADPNPYSLPPVQIGDTGLIVTINLLRDSLLKPLCDGIERYHGKAGSPWLDWNRTPFCLRSVLTPSADHRDRADLLTFDTLQGSAIARSAWNLEFKSPTAFKQRGSNLPLPDPFLVVDSLVKRWNAVSPIPLPDDIRSRIGKHVKVDGLEGIRSCKARSHVGQTGFVGKVRFAATEALDTTCRQWLDRLFRFGEFAGVGMKTAFGMGHVALLPLDVRFGE